MPGLSTFGIAASNLHRRPWRSFCLIMAILLFSFFLFAGSVLSLSLSRGAESTANRLGADIMLVPVGMLVAILAGTPVGSTIVAVDMAAFGVFFVAGKVLGGMK